MRAKVMGWTHRQWIGAIQFYDNQHQDDPVNYDCIEDYMLIRCFWWNEWFNPPSESQLRFTGYKAEHTAAADTLFGNFAYEHLMS